MLDKRLKSMISWIKWDPKNINHIRLENIRPTFWDYQNVQLKENKQEFVIDN